MKSERSFVTTPTTRPGRLPRLVAAALVASTTAVVFAALGGVGFAKSAISAAQYQYGKNKVTLCHKPGTPAEHTITVAQPAVPAHMAHGDRPGTCGALRAAKAKAAKAKAAKAKAAKVKAAKVKAEKAKAAKAKAAKAKAAKAKAAKAEAAKAKAEKAKAEKAKAEKAKAEKAKAKPNKGKKAETATPAPSGTDKGNNGKGKGKGPGKK
jgi:hypothetical protein